MPKQSDLQKAKDLLCLWPDKWLTAEEVKNLARLDIGVPALARKMRLFRSNGELESRKREGKTYMEYRVNPSYLLAKVYAKCVPDQQTFQQGLF